MGFRAVEITFKKRKCGACSGGAVLLVDDDQDTLQFVRENIRDFVSNVVAVRRATA